MTEQRYGDEVPVPGSGSGPHDTPPPPMWYAVAVPLLLAVLAAVMVIAGS